MLSKIKVKNILVTVYFQAFEEDNLDEIDYNIFADDFKSLIDAETKGGWINEVTVAGVGVAAELNTNKRDY